VPCSSALFPARDMGVLTKLGGCAGAGSPRSGSSGALARVLRVRGRGRAGARRSCRDGLGTLHEGDKMTRRKEIERHLAKARLEGSEPDIRYFETLLLAEVEGLGLTEAIEQRQLREAK
jgi:hypothetical protein